MRRSLHRGACPSTFLVLILTATSMLALAGCREGGRQSSQPAAPEVPGTATGAVSGYVFRVDDHGRSQLGVLVIRPSAAAPAGGQPAAGAAVTLSDATGVVRSTSTAPDGFFSMGVEARIYTLTASLPGYTPVSMPVNVPPEQTLHADSTAAPPVGGMGATLRVVSASAPDGTHVDLFFSQQVSAGSVTAAAFSIQPTLTVLDASLAANGLSVRLTTREEQVRFYPYTVHVAGVTDTSANGLDAAASSASFQGNGIPPQVVSASAQSEASDPSVCYVDVLFSEAVGPAEAAAAANYAIQPSAEAASLGARAVEITAAALQPDGVTIHLTTRKQVQGATYEVAVQGVKDLAGNAVDVTRNSARFMGVSLPLTLETVTAVDPTHLDVRFSERVDETTALVARGYRIEPSTLIFAAEWPADPDYRTVRLTTGEHNQGTRYSLTAFDARDLAGNKVDPSRNTFGYAGKGEAPGVESVTAIGGTTVNVVFSEGVDPVGANKVASYALSPALEILAAALGSDSRTVRLTTALQDAAQEYTLTVSGIQDVAGNRLDLARATGTFQGSPVYPRVTSAQGMDATHVDVLFSKPVQPAEAGAAANYTIAFASPPAQADLAAPVVSAAQLQADGRTVRLTTSEQLRYQPYRVTVQNVHDTAGYALDPLWTAATFSGTGAPPQVVAISPVDSTRVDVLFDEELDRTAAVSTENYAVAPRLVVTAAELKPDGTTVRLTTAEQTEGTFYSLTVANLKDKVGNSTGVLSGVGIWQGMGLAPRVVSASALDGDQVDLLFNETLDKTEAEKAANYFVDPPLAVTGARLQPDGRTVRLVTGTQTKDRIYILTVRSVQDAAGNAVDPSHNGASFSGTEGKTAPRVVSATGVDASYVHVLFSERVGLTGAVTAGNYTISPSLAVRRAEVLADGVTVRLTTDSQSAGAAYTLAVRNVQDLAGTVVDAAAATASFTGSGAADLPRLAGAVAVDGTHVDLEFSELLAARSVAAVANYEVTPQLVVASAALRPDGKSVRLVTGEQAGDQRYTLVVRNVQDLAGNAVDAAANSASFTGVGTPGLDALSNATVAISPSADPDPGNPQWPTNADPFLYRVTYTSPDNVAPLYVRLTITGPDGRYLGVFPMVKEDPSDISYSDGCRYCWESSLLPGPIGLYGYRIDASDGRQLSVPVIGSGPQVNGVCPGRIVFASDRAGGYALFTMNADGTGSVRISATGLHAYAPRWAPDGSRVIFAASDGLYTALADGSAQTKLAGTSRADSWPDWSRTSGRIAFASTRDGNSEIYTANPDGSDPLRLTRNEGDDAFPAWSPDGSQIAFVSTRDGNQEIYVMDADGSRETRITYESANDWEPRWSPDGSQVVFTSARDGNNEIYVMNADGSGQTRLTRNTMIDWHPTWMADGRHLLFASYREGDGEIYVMSDDGSGQMPLTNNNAQDMSPAYSASQEASAPYSASITCNPAVLPASRSSQATLKVTVRDGGYRPFAGAQVSLALTPASLGDIAPLTGTTDDNGQMTAILTAGETPGLAVVTAEVAGGLRPKATIRVPIEFSGRIAFVTDRHGGSATEIYTVGANGSDQTRLTYGADVRQHPSWSPDGSRLVVAIGSAGAEDIYRIEADGGSPVRLTDDPASDVDPAWSPDGTRVAFASNRDGNYEIYVVNADGTNLRRVTADGAGAEADDRRPSWSPDCTWLAFDSTRSGTTVEIMRVDGSDRSTLTAGSAPAWAPDDSCIAFQANDAGNADIYTIHADGSARTPLTTDAADDTQPAWAVQSPFIVFTSTRDGDAEIYVMNGDGTGQTRVTRSAGADTSPTCTWAGGAQAPSAYSISATASASVLRANGADACAVTAVVRDGGYRLLPGIKVTFSSPLGTFEPEAVVTDDKGQAEVQFIAGTEPGLALITAKAEGGRAPEASVAVTLDAGHIVFESNRDGNWEIYRMRGDGGEQTNLTNNAAEDRQPAPSPDGRRIAFVSKRTPDGKSHIWVMDRNGGDVLQVTGKDPAGPYYDEVDPAWSSDATRIYFASDRGAGMQIYSISPDGDYSASPKPTFVGTPAEITSGAGAKSAPFTSGTWVGYSAPGPAGDLEIFLRKKDTELFAQYGFSGARDYDATLYVPDNLAAFTSERDGNPEIYRMRVTDPASNQQTQTRLTQNSAWDGQPAWWPIGAKIAFASRRDGNGEIYVMNADGSSQVRLTNNTADDLSPEWLMGPETPAVHSVALVTSKASMPASPNASCVVWADVRDGAFLPMADVPVSFRITIGTLDPANAETGSDGLCSVTLRGKHIGSMKTWEAPPLTASAGGVSVTVFPELHAGYHAYHGTVGGNTDIYVRRAGVAPAFRITTAAEEDSWPAWSPDGSQIAFQRLVGGKWQIYVATLDKDNYPQVLSEACISDGLANDTAPAWRTADRIAFVSDRFQRSPGPGLPAVPDLEICTMSSDGSNIAAFTDFYGADLWPSWTPGGGEGARLTFSRDMGAPYGYEIFTAAADGSDVRRLTYSEGDDTHPSWSPDGQKILFHSMRDGYAQVYTVNPDGTGQTRVLPTTSADTNPCWAPDGLKILVTGILAGSGLQDLGWYALDTREYGYLGLDAASPEGAAWSWGYFASETAASRAVAARRAEAVVRLRAFSAGQEALARLTSSGLEPQAGSGRTAGLRFVPLGATAASGRARPRTWDFAVAAARPGAEVSLSWPDLSGLGGRDRVVLEDLDARARRSMRTTAAYAFRVGDDAMRRFRITAAPRTGPLVAITGIELVQTRAGARAVRFVLSSEADVDVDVIGPTGRPVATVTRAQPARAGTNLVSWTGRVSPGIYLLRITARAEEGTVVQATRPVAIVR